MKQTSEKITTYCFLIEDAEKYGVEEAVFLYNVRYWVSTNKAKESEFHKKNNRYWMWNSRKGFKKLFPFWSERQIERISNNLIAKRAILAKNFFEKDRTLWYTTNDKESLCE